MGDVSRSDEVDMLNIPIQFLLFLILNPFFLHVLSALFGLMYIAIIWLTILGSDYSKSKSHIKNIFKFRSPVRNGATFKHSFSLFNTGLFNLALDSPVYYLLKCNFL